MNILNKIIEALKDMDTEELINVYNAYNHYYCISDLDLFIFQMDDLKDLKGLRTPEEFLKDVADGFNTSDKYIFGGVHGLKSFTDISDGPEICIEKIAHCIVENMDPLGNTKLKDILIDNILYKYNTVFR